MLLNSATLHNTASSAHDPTKISSTFQHGGDSLRPAAAELHKWSLSFQRQLDRLSSQHAAHVELLSMLADDGEGTLGLHSADLHATQSIPLARAGGDIDVGFGHDIWDGCEDTTNDEPPVVLNGNIRRDQNWSATLPSSASQSTVNVVVKQHPWDQVVDEDARSSSGSEERAKPVDGDPQSSSGSEERAKPVDGDAQSSCGSEAPAEKDLALPVLREDSKETLDVGTEMASEVCHMVEAHRFWSREPDWNSRVSHTGMASLHLAGTMSFKESSGAEELAVTGSIRRDRGRASRACVIRPGSVHHLTHAVISLLIILYDIMSLPLTTAFQLENNPTLYFMDLAACCFWSFDVFMNFLIGYPDNDRIEMRFRAIAKRYLKTWFFFDIMVISFDWITLLISDVRGLGFARTFKAPRFVRIFFRTLRLLRLVKLVLVLEDVLHCLVSEWVNSTIGIAKMLLGIVVFNHFVACGWYAVGVSGARPNWVDELDHEGASTFHRYVVSFHWSMCQYTPAPNDFHPRNFYERLYACVTLLFGIAVFSAFLGKITSLLTHMSATAFARSRHEKAMKQYLAANMVTLDIANRINAFLKNRSGTIKVLPYNEVHHFNHLPKTLALELKSQAHSPCLAGHAMFAYLSSSQENFPFVFKLCSRAVLEVGLKWGDELLHVGNSALQMIFVKHGKLRYVNQVLGVRDPAEQNTVTTASSEIDIVSMVGPGQRQTWTCEMALWCQWTYRGHLKALGNSIALILEVAAFHALVLANPAVFAQLKKYAQVYVDSLNEALQEDFLSVDDLWGNALQVGHMTEEAFSVQVSERKRTRRSVHLGLKNSLDGLTRSSSTPSMFGDLVARLRIGNSRKSTRSN